MQEETANPLGSQPEAAPPKTHWLLTLAKAIGCAALCFFGLIVGLLLVNPRGGRSRNGGQLTACKSNCKNIATALEMYASDNGGRYPPTLEPLLITGNYLKLIPTCPAAGKMTYTNYQCSQSPDCFSYACVGNNHGKAYSGFDASAENYPRYQAEQGLLDHP